MSQQKYSTLGFGCASIMGKVGRKPSLQAMELAYDLEVTHFDTARSYGFGRAEELIGEFIKDKREKVTITSKFGVVPPQQNWKTRTLIPVAREIAKAIPAIKKGLTKKSGKVLANKQFDIAYAQKCLDESLTKLNTDYIDNYLLHEPNISELANRDELQSFFEKALSQGKIRQFGIAFITPESAKGFGRFGDVSQIEGNIATLKACVQTDIESETLFITRPFNGGDLKAIEACMARSEYLKSTGLNTSEIALALSVHMAQSKGSVICSMFNEQHIKANVAAIEKIKNDSTLPTDVFNDVYSIFDQV